MGVAGIAALTTLLGLPVHAATSFPNHPLLTGGNALPPNILMILDDSGSMDRSWMWADKDTSSGTSDTVTDRSYVNNSLYYNPATRSEEHTSELQSLMRISYAVFCLKKKTQTTQKRKMKL